VGAATAEEVRVIADEEVAETADVADDAETEEEEEEAEEEASEGTGAEAAEVLAFFFGGASLSPLSSSYHPTTNQHHMFVRLSKLRQISLFLSPYLIFCCGCKLCRLLLCCSRLCFYALRPSAITYPHHIASHYIRHHMS